MDPDPESIRQHETIDDDLRILADSLPHLVWITRPDGYHVYFNARWRAYTGLDALESFGEGWFINALHPDDRERTTQVWTHSLRTGDPYEIEYRFRGGDGEYRWFLGRALPQRDASGRIVRWFGTCTDIEGKKAAESALQKSEAWFRTLIEGSADMFATLTLDATYLYCSPSVEEQLGWKPAELVGRNAFDFIHPDDTPRIGTELRQMADTRARRFRTRLKFRSGSGDYRDCDVTVRLVDGVDGKPLMIVNSRDITESDRVQRRIEESERLVSLGRVASAMAHEFNNVLMGIQPQAEILKRLGDQRSSQCAERIQHSVARGKSVTEQVLRFTRAEVPRVAAVPVLSVVEASVMEVSLQLPANVQVRTEVEEPDLHMLAEASHIEQTIVNLCLNSRDVMPGGGTIRVTVRRASDDVCRNEGLVDRGFGYVEIAVKDSGPGVPAELRERIFEPLFSTRKRSGGSGLGLSIARQIAHAHGGALTLDDGAGTGATFRLVLPLAPLASTETRGHEEGLRVPSRVLLVEDDDLVAEGIVMNLEQVGAKTLRVSRGADALAAARQFDPEVVLLDYSLSDMNGTEVHRALRAERPGVPVVFVTGHADAEVIEAEIGEAAVICNKPVTLGQLLLAVAEARAR